MKIKIGSCHDNTESHVYRAYRNASNNAAGVTRCQEFSGLVPSRVHLRTKVTPSLHLTYSKKRGEPGVGIEIDKYSLFSINISYSPIF